MLSVSFEVYLYFFGTISDVAPSISVFSYKSPKLGGLNERLCVFRSAGGVCIYMLRQIIVTIARFDNMYPAARDAVHAL